ncbi:MAG: FCD domain-containing protein [Anaerolineaceae bacterium]
MVTKRIFTNGRSELLCYLAELAKNGESRVESLNELSTILSTSTATLREQLEVARVMGLVDIKPRKGITIREYSLRPAVQQSVGYAISINPDNFNTFSDLRNHIEAAYWSQAVPLLTAEDHRKLISLVEQAKRKLETKPIQIPQYEHRQLHLTIYARLNNPFVNGILEAFWDLYDAVGYGLYADFSYLQNVWNYHDRIVKAIIAGDFATGYQVLVEHNTLIRTRTRTTHNQLFE